MIESHKTLVAIKEVRKHKRHISVISLARFGSLGCILAISHSFLLKKNGDFSDIRHV